MFGFLAGIVSFSGGGAGEILSFFSKCNVDDVVCIVVYFV